MSFALPRPLARLGTLAWLAGTPVVGATLSAKQELASRIRVQALTASGLAQVGISAAPLLIVLDPQDRVRYEGGYSDRKQGPQIGDLEILASAYRGQAVAAHPLFGPAISEQPKRQRALLGGL